MHYLGDVVVGAALGVTLLAVCTRVVGDDPTRGFALAAFASVPALVVSSLGAEALLAFGGSLGGALGSVRLDGLGELGSRFHGVVLAVVGVPFVFLADGLAEAVTEPPLVVPRTHFSWRGYCACPRLSSGFRWNRCGER